ncbi:2OG-Fe(II) oxygenase family protein [Xenorhabdus sp. Flor]|uniref:2OG-Fe(II) oxygenase family protein n=1 Tax=Xenorhabdus cabanillasii TaxID=351673 RepID=UPI0019920546|nr:2OG-Fe(II) oxygenase family protein [Xenorhabdus sp. Flor]
MTILLSTAPGLLAYIDGKLWAINPEPGYFIVNFGSSIEVLTENMILKIHANIHGVIRTNKDTNERDRVSYALFLDSSLNGDIYRYGFSGPEKIQKTRMDSYFTKRR